MDNASNNGLMKKTLAFELRQKNPHLPRSEHFLPCLGHVYNLAVQQFIKVLEPNRKAVDESSTDAIKKIGGVIVDEIVDVFESLDESASTETEEIVDDRELLVDYDDGGVNRLNVLRKHLKSIKYSLNHLETLEDSQKENGLKNARVVLDVKTRWNSLYSMIDWALKNKEVRDFLL